MAKRRAKASKPKSKPSKKVAVKKVAAKKVAAKAAPPAGASHLHQVIQELIDAKRRGDAEAGKKAASALEAIRKGHAAAPVRQAAAEASAVAANDDSTERLRLLTNIAVRVRAQA